MKQLRYNCVHCNKDTYYDNDAVYEGITLNHAETLKTNSELPCFKSKFYCKHCKKELYVNLWFNKDYEKETLEYKIKAIKDLQEMDNEVIKKLPMNHAYIQFEVEEMLTDNKFTTIVINDRLYFATKKFWRIYKLEEIDYKWMENKGYN